ncbi:hypothetical protein [Paenibacillus sp. FSL H8-0332]|uniref:hypothetical protein n=1 Tax=Paenibacillus sp. FSL H8-0332 TaxID=2954742 RepID=UPI0030CC65C5
MMKHKYDFKQSIIRRVRVNSSVSKSPAWSLRRRFTAVTLSCLLLLILAALGPLLVRSTNQANPAVLFNGFMVTAYAADGVPVAVQPDVEFPLGKYSMFMSSVPGFPLTLVAEGADRIELQASEGELLLWNPADSKILPQRQAAAVQSGDTIYWSPIADGSSQPAATDGILEVTAYRDNHKLGSTVIQIHTQDHIFYSGKLVYK